MERDRRGLTAVTVLVPLVVLGAHWLPGFDKPMTSPGSSLLPSKKEADSSRAPRGGALPVTRPPSNVPGAPGWGRATSGLPQDAPDPPEAVTDSAEIEVRWIGDSLDPEDDVPDELEPVALGEFLDPDAPDVGYSDAAVGEVVDLGVSLDPDTSSQETWDLVPPVQIGEPRDVEVR